MIAFLVLLYLFALVAYGAWHSRKVCTQEDFAVAGRKLSAPVLVGTMMATWIGSGSLMSGAEATYQRGITMVAMPLFGVIGLYVLSRLAPRVRGVAGLTVQDIMERRYGIAARILSTVAIIIAYTTILSYQYRAGGAVVDTIFPQFAPWCDATFPKLSSFLRNNTQWIDASWGSVLAAVFIIAYTVLGGLLSVAYTDVINGIVMTVGVLVGVPFLYHALGGAAGIAHIFSATPEKLTWFGPTLGQTPFERIIWTINYVLPGMMLLMGEANMYQRFFAARNEREARRAGLMLIPAVLIVETAIILLAFLSSAAEPALGDDDFRHVILIAARSHMPIMLAVLILGAAVAIVISTADSFLLVSSNCVVRDIYHRFVNPQASGERLVAVSRWTVVVVGIAGFIASIASKQFLTVALWAYTVYGAAITPSLLAAFFWPRATAAGATAAIAGGIITTILWGLADMHEKLPHAVASYDAVFPAMIVSVLLLITVSLRTPPPRAEKLALLADQRRD